MDIVSINHGESYGVPTELIMKMNPSSLGVLLKLLAATQEGAMEFLKQHNTHNSKNLDFWIQNISAAGYIYRRKQGDSWQYVISHSPMSIEAAADGFASMDAEAAKAPKEGKV